MSTRALIGAVAALTLLVAACAPTTAGSSANAPVLATAGAAPVELGSAVYVRVDYDLSDFGLSPSDLRASLWVPSGYDSEVGDVSTQFGLVEPRVAEGWNFSLVTVRAERRSIRGSGAFDANRTEFSLMAVFRVEAPNDAIPGPYRFRADLRARGAGSQSVTINVEARPAGAS